LQDNRVRTIHGGVGEGVAKFGRVATDELPVGVYSIVGRLDKVSAWGARARANPHCTDARRGKKGTEGHATD